MVTPRTKGSGQKVLSSTGGEWLHLEQSVAARRCEMPGVNGCTWNKGELPEGVERCWV